MTRRIRHTWPVLLTVSLVGLAWLVAACSEDDFAGAPADRGQRATEAFGGQERDAVGEPAAPAPAPAPTQTTVNAGLRDFVIEPQVASVPAGEVTFVVQNRGSSAHSFDVLRTNLPAEALPLAEGETQADVNGEGVILQGEIPTFAPDKTRRITLALDPGQYLLICNEPGHYILGMVVEFTVT